MLLQLVYFVVVGSMASIFLLLSNLKLNMSLELISKVLAVLGQMLVADEDAGDAEHGQEVGG
ncbi:hypothetical protein ABZ631_04245, partial [Nocardiopsis alba]|uniref:hypothetical protein n=1 Tax=Nocardiopsis alba TaxID=53437 RepID=UPI0033E613D9